MGPRTMTLVRVHVTLVALAAGAFLALVGATGSAAATTTTCDTNPANAVRVGWSQAQIAPSGSLAPNNSTTLTATAVNSSGQCVAGARVVVFLDPAVGGGSATTTTAGCPVGRLTPNWDFCTADANGAVIVWYTAPATLPNGGTDSIHAKVGAQLPPSVPYTFGTLTLTASALTATEGAPSTAVVATLTERDLPTAPPLTPTVHRGPGTSSIASRTPAPPPVAPPPRRWGRRCWLGRG